MTGALWGAAFASALITAGSMGAICIAAEEAYVSVMFFFIGLFIAGCIVTGTLMDIASRGA